MHFDDGASPPDEIIEAWIALVQDVFGRRNEDQKCIAVHCGYRETRFLQHRCSSVAQKVWQSRQIMMRDMSKALNDEFLDQSSMPLIRRRLIYQRPDYRGTVFVEVFGRSLEIGRLAQSL
jgi:hypothetical protein